MSSTAGTSPLLSPSSPTATSSSTTAASTSTSATSSGNPNGNPASATLLFGFLVIFVALFAAFLLLAVLWQYQRRRREAAASSQAVILEFDESKGTYRGVPRMWEVWIQHEPSGGHWEWENIRPLSVDIDNTSSGQPIAQASQSRRWRRIWPHNLFRRRPVPPQPPPAPAPPPPQEAQQQQQQQADATSASAPVLISGVRMSFVIAMPNADAPTNRRQSQISQVSCVRESWRHREFALGIYHPPFREDCAL